MGQQKLSYCFAGREFLLYMDITFDKPFRSYSEQIEIIKDKNVIVENEVFAEIVLSSLSYHTLINGYKKTFLNKDGTDNFVTGTTFETLYTMHILDSNINNLIFKNILFFERSFKTKLSYVIAKDFGVYSDFDSENISREVEDYLCINHYAGGYRRIPTLEDLRKMVAECKAKDKILFHYKKNKNHIPPWILITKATLGQAVQWYKILKGQQKSEICSQMLPYLNCDLDQRKLLLYESIEFLRKFRNNCAHGHRTFCSDLSQNIPGEVLLEIIPKHVLCDEEYRAGIGKSDLFSVLLLIFMLVHDPYILRNFINDLDQIMKPYKKMEIAGKTIYEIFDIPENYSQKLENFGFHKFNSR